MRFASTCLSALCIVVSALLTVACGSNPELPDHVALVVEGDTLTLDDLSRSLANAEGDTARAMAGVNALVNRMLVLHDASSRGFDTLPETRRFFYEKMRERLQHQLFAYHLDRIQIEEDTLRAFYDGLGTEVSYLVVSSQDSAVAVNYASRVRNGESLAQVQGESLRVEYMGPVDLMNVDSRAAAVLRGMEPGEVAGPVYIGVYWRTYRLDSLNAVDPGSFEDNRRWISNMLLSQKREEVKQALEDSLRTAYNLQVDTAVVEMIAEKALDRTGEHRPYSEAEAAMPAYTWRGGERPALWLANNIRSLPEMAPRRANDAEWVAGYCNILGLYDIMATEARQIGLDTLPEVRSRVRRSREQYLLELYHDSVIATRIPPVSQEMLRETYENQETPLTVPAVRVFELLMADGAEEVEALNNMMEAGADPFGRTDLFTPHPMFAESEGSFTTKPMKAGELPPQLADSLMSVEEGALVRLDIGPQTVALFRAGRLDPSREATFEEARSAIESRVRADLEEEVVSGLVDSLRQEYDYTINRDLIYNSCGSDSTAADSTGGA